MNWPAAISAEAIGRHVTALTAHGPRHESCPAAVPAALRYITDELHDSGLAVAVERYGGDLHEVNLIAGAAGPAVELGAHWDSVAARALNTGYPVRFCFYGGEEDGFLGSTAHVRRAAAGIRGAVVLEMIGYRSTAPGSQRLPPGAAAFVDVPQRGDFIAVVADAGSAGYAEALERAAAAHAPGLPVRSLVLPRMLKSAVSRSDHVPYWRAGRRAVMVTDTAEYRNPHYHRPGDLPATLDLEFAAAVTRAVTGAVAELAGAPVPGRAPQD